MEEIGGPILFIIIVAASWILQARKERIERKHAQEIAQKRKQSPSDLPEETRRQLYGDTGPREAQRKGTGRPPPENTGPPVAPGSDLFETLFGGSPKPQEAQEGEEGWVPVDTARRREPQQRHPQQTRRQATATTREAAPPPLRPTAQPQSVEDMHEQRQQAARQKQAERQLRKQRRARAQKEHALQQKQLEWEHRRRAASKRSRGRVSSQPKQRRTRLATPHHELFTGLGDVRRAVILSEILAPPKGFQQNVEPKLFSD